MQEVGNATNPLRQASCTFWHDLDYEEDYDYDDLYYDDLDYDYLE